MYALPYPFASLLAGAFLTLLTFVLFLNIFGLPANWIILGLDALWRLLVPGYSYLGWFFWTVLVLLACIGEALEFLLQVTKARKYGSSSSGAWGGMIGAIIGAIFLAPLFWGIGAFIGALLGAWAGCLIMELAKGRSQKEAVRAAFGTMLGRFLGTICKIGIGGAMIAFTGKYIWPEEVALPPLDDAFFVTVYEATAWLSRCP